MRDDYPVEPVKPRLWRSRRHKVIAGVVGGLAEKFRIDPSFARVLYVGFSIFSAGFPGLFVYILLWMITKPHGERDAWHGEHELYP